MPSIGRSTLILVLGAVAAALSVPGCALVGLGGGPKMRLFVSNYRDDTVSVIEGDPEHEVKVLHVGDSPEGLALRNDPPLVAVANGTSSHVTLIDPVRMKILGTLPCSTGPEAVSFSADGKLLYVTSPREKKIDILDVEAGKAAFDSIATPGQPTRLALSPDGRRLYVTLHETKGAVLVVDTSTRRIVRRVPVGRFPTGVVLSRDGSRLLAASFDDSTVTVIDTETLEALHTFPVDTGYGLVIHPTEPVVYSMDSFDDQVYRLNYETGAVSDALSFGNWPTYSAITSDGRFLYVVQENSNNVAKVDTRTNEMVLRIAVGTEPANAVIFER